jgi:hypothetical protein
MGNRPVGRPRQRWQEDVMEGLKKLKIKKLEGHSYGQKNLERLG